MARLRWLSMEENNTVLQAQQHGVMRVWWIEDHQGNQPTVSNCCGCWLWLIWNEIFKYPSFELQLLDNISIVVLAFSSPLLSIVKLQYCPAFKGNVLMCTVYVYIYIVECFAHFCGAWLVGMVTFLELAHMVDSSSCRKSGVHNVQTEKNRSTPEQSTQFGTPWNHGFPEMSKQHHFVGFSNSELLFRCGF